MQAIEKEIDKTLSQTRKQIQREERQKFRYIHAIDLSILFFGVVAFIGIMIALVLAPLASWGLILIGITAFLLIWVPVAAFLLSSESPTVDARSQRERRWRESHGE